MQCHAIHELTQTAVSAGLFVVKHLHITKWNWMPEWVDYLGKASYPTLVLWDSCSLYQHWELFSNQTQNTRTQKTEHKTNKRNHLLSSTSTLHVLSVAFVANWHISQFVKPCQGAVALMTLVGLRQLATRVLVQLHILDLVCPLLDVSGHGGAHNCHHSTIPTSGPTVEPESILVQLPSGSMSLRSRFSLCCHFLYGFPATCQWLLCHAKGNGSKNGWSHRCLHCEGPMSRLMMLIYSREGWARWLPFGNECATFALKLTCIMVPSLVKMVSNVLRLLTLMRLCSPRETSGFRCLRKVIKLATGSGLLCGWRSLAVDTPPWCRCLLRYLATHQRLGAWSWWPSVLSVASVTTCHCGCHVQLLLWHFEWNCTSTYAGWGLDP